MSPPLQRQLGVVIRDDRVSGGERVVAPAHTCCHCNTVHVILPDPLRARLGVPPRSHPRGYCQRCHGYVCDNPTCNTLCTPVMALIDLALKRPDIPTLQRGPNGGLLFDPALLDTVRSF